MKKVFIAAAMLFAPACFASQVVCTGDYFGYTFTMNAKTDGHKIVGKATVVVSDGSSVVKSGAMNITSSAVSIGESIVCAGGIDGLGQGNLSANFDGNSYRGQMAAGTSMGTFHIDTTCTIH